MSDYVIIGCGNAKRATPHPAADLYTSAYLRTAVAWARSVTTADRLLILSAKYGLIRGSDVIAPYQATFGKTHGFAATRAALEPPVTVAEVARQVVAYPHLNGPIITLAGKDYYRVLLAASSGRLIPYNPFFPLLDAAGHDHRTGYQAQAMKAHMGRIPGRP